MSLSSLNPGKLDRLITPRYPVASRGTSGSAKIASWTETTTSWAAWMPEGGREYVAASARRSDVTGVLRIRYRADVRSTWRITADGVLYEILGVSEVGRRSYLDLSVKRASVQEADFSSTDFSASDFRT